MFGKFFKDLFGKKEESSHTVHQENQFSDEPSSTLNRTSDNSMNQDSGTIQDIKNQEDKEPEIRYYEVEIYDDIEDYIKIMISIFNQLLNNEGHFRYATSKKNYALMRQSKQQWISDIEIYKSHVNQLGPYADNRYLMDKGLESLDKRKNWLESYFDEYIDALEANDIQNATRLEKTLWEVQDINFKAFNDDIHKFRQIINNKQNDQFTEIIFNEQSIMAHEIADNNPLFEPIHGISLYDYAAGTSLVGTGKTEAEIIADLGVEKPQWDEASLLWQQRMQEDTTMAVLTLFSEYFGKTDQHPKLGKPTNSGNIETENTASQSENPNLEKIKTDEKFFYELAGEREAAFEIGKDGGQHILEKYGIALTDFQSQAMIWMRSGNMNTMLDYQFEKKEEYLKQFRKETGGTIADDIEF